VTTAFDILDAAQRNFVAVRTPNVVDIHAQFPALPQMTFGHSLSYGSWCNRSLWNDDGVPNLDVIESGEIYGVARAASSTIVMQSRKKN
jgi:hypothetical protein